MTDHVVLDPTSESLPIHRPVAGRPPSLESLSVGLVDISKRRSDEFLDQVERQLRGREIEVVRFVKPTHAKVVPADLRNRITTECGAVIQALAD